MVFLPILIIINFVRRVVIYNMQNGIGCSNMSKRFDLPGSTAHYPQILPFTIDYMWLQIKPDFDSSSLRDCTVKLKITALRDINEIGLDIAEIQIHHVTSLSDSLLSVSYDVLQEDDKLNIKLGRTLNKDSSIDLDIRYSAGYYRENGIIDVHKPRSGFYFVSSSGENPSIKQAWTQGEALESKYWFPCLEDPRVKFAREIQITVPEDDYVVISNGELAEKELNTWTWIEQNPTPAYLTSVVIGKFAQEEHEYHYDDDRDGKKNTIPLLYYWPKEIPREDAMLTFANTPNMIRFFEEYFDIKYPYKKYSQVAVEGFELGGMENTNCTILTKYILHDKTAAIDYTIDIDVVCHELAHQWFGDLVTCRDWSNLWLNEGFATYCEMLYRESVQGFDEFCYRVVRTADEYFEESRRLYKRPLVTRIYKHPDDLFDAHSYEKGGCVLHMLRSDIGETNFRKSINRYLDAFKNKTAETDDLCKIVEDVSTKSMRQFFDQWVYRSGHPRLDIELTLQSLENSYNVKIKISQIQDQVEDDGSGNTGGDNQSYGDLFEFFLDIRLVFSTTNDTGSSNYLETIPISKRTTEHSIEIPKDVRIEWISIDPQFKILKEIKSIRITNETSEFQLRDVLKNQLRKGKTIIERVEAARALKNQYSKDVVDELQIAVVTDPFYGVSIEAANTLGSYYEKNNYSKSNKAYSALLSCLDKEKTFSGLHPEIKQAIVRNVGQFERKDSVNILEPLLHQQSESYLVRANAATAIGKSIKDGISSSLDNAEKEKMIFQLKDIAKTSESFRNVIATGAIEGLKELSKDKNRDTVADIANFLIENTNSKSEYFKRLAATSALSKFLLLRKDNERIPNIHEMNLKVSRQLLELLFDSRRKVKINACKALADPDGKPTRYNATTFETIDVLIHVAEHDVDAFVRREAERCANIIREWINEWSSKPLTLNTKIREA
jgi:aminopeptidase N